MKTVKIKNADHFQYNKNFEQNPVSMLKDIFIDGPDSMEVSDGYHTFDELYDHRITLYIKLCDVLSGYSTNCLVWRSELHSDGSRFDGQFLLGIGKEKGQQITYHLPMERWNETNFAETFDQAPEWDGHSSADVLERIKGL